MELIALLILMSVSSSCQLTGPKEVSGQLGGSVTVKCQYDLKYKDHVKQWCKGNYYYLVKCPVVVSTKKPEEGRISLTDNKTQGIFSITMDNLMKSDEGQYTCVIETPTFEYNQRISIDLKVSQGQPQSSTISPTTSATGNTKASVNTTGNTKASVITTLTISPIHLPHSVEAWHVTLPIVMVLIILLLSTALILYVKLKQQKKNGIGAESPATCKENQEVTYSAVTVVPRPDLENTYLNLQDLTAQRTARNQDFSETVEYSAILV
ncbi:CMRF35-like molecule 8 [Mustelus asterias]